MTGVTELQPRDAMELIVPGTGEAFDLTDPAVALTAWDAITRVEELLADYKSVIRSRLLAESEVVGTKTLHYPTGDAVITGGPTDAYDPEELREALREAGLPEDRLDDTVRLKVEYRVMKNEVNRLKSANPRYAAAIESVRVTEELPRGVRITPNPRGHR